MSVRRHKVSSKFGTRNHEFEIFNLFLMQRYRLTASLIPAELPSFLGKLQCAEAQLWGRAGRLALYDLRQLNHLQRTPVHLDDPGVAALRVLRDRLLHGRPRTIKASAPTRPFLVFTDGALEGSQASIGGVLVKPQQDGSASVSGGPVPPEALMRWQSDGKVHVVGLVELYGAVVALRHWRHQLCGERVIVFIDNWPTRPTLDVLIKGAAFVPLWRELLLVLEDPLGSEPTLCWFARVPSKSNIADGPSRADLGDLRPWSLRIDKPVCPLTGELEFPRLQLVFFVNCCSDVKFCAIAWQGRKGEVTGVLSDLRTVQTRKMLFEAHRAGRLPHPQRDTRRAELFLLFWISTLCWQPSSRRELNACGDSCEFADAEVQVTFGMPRGGAIVSQQAHFIVQRALFHEAAVWDAMRLRNSFPATRIHVHAPGGTTKVMPNMPRDFAFMFKWALMRALIRPTSVNPKYQVEPATVLRSDMRSGGVGQPLLRNHLPFRPHRFPGDPHLLHDLSPPGEESCARARECVVAECCAKAKVVASDASKRAP
ncbi:hypothetical protein AK812_SmicGene28330 [Symbiodinium microadriaticum]|uniref:Uncharacterized protein n=1 Tax=Symbiodinium microadriaticum TaxID=2951 RepID=A0A1Q9D4Q0_SYMMI|nr:hypothetical protein AK812_SmicGene28330 [Symbiodinium microadriaticum]